MRNICVFEKNVPIALSPGVVAGKRDSYETFVTCRGLLDEKTGQRQMNQNDIVQDNRTFLTVRYQIALWNELNDDQNKSIKVMVDDRMFTIASWTRLNNKNFYIRFTLNEKR
jgi:hypothetical protein